MKKILKKTVWFTVMLCLVVITLFAAGGCNKPKNQLETCNFENPLTDLPWLKEKIEEITLLFQDNPLHITIYQCMYDDGQTGFLIDEGNIKPFYNCKGEVLCIMGGDAGETCPELNIDLANKKLIWEINNNMHNCKFTNPLTDLPWLKEIIDGIEKDTEGGYKQHVRIYQCTYVDGIGFLLELCVDCPDFGYWLKSCKGESLCILFGYAGDPCEELNVDFENKTLIWEINN